MKKLLAALILMPSLANAGFCDAVYDFAEATMKMRQEGYPKYVAKQAADETRQENVLLADVLEATVDWAYSHPIYNDERAQQLEVEFANSAYEICKENGF